jgi:hypothetical protein
VEPTSSDAVSNPFFSDHFGVAPEDLEAHGAFDISLVADLPLFIDPFLLFTSQKQAYRQLHDNIIQYVRFLRDKAAAQEITPGFLKAWFIFSEVRQTWLGFSRTGNRGSGLGPRFAQALSANLHTVFANFGAETVTRGSHIEKLCLVGTGVGRDHVSDFTTNLIKRFLCDYTQVFAQKFVGDAQKRRVPVERVQFDYGTETWASESFDLPWYDGDYVLLTPKDLLTKDETWINRPELLHRFEQLLEAIPDDQLRAQLNNYFRKHLPDLPKEKERRMAAAITLQHYPEVAEYFIRDKEEHGAEAKSVAGLRVVESQHRYIVQVRSLSLALLQQSPFYALKGDTLAEARQRVSYLKHVIEDQNGYRAFYVNGQPVQRESDLQIMFRLTWCGTVSDVSSEVNNGRGPVDFKISRGAFDKTLVEFKLASNTHLRRNLQNQVKIYEQATETKKSLRVILYFSEAELAKVHGILTDLGLTADDSIILIDARRDNKPSASTA